MTPIDWTNISRTASTFIQQTFDVLPLIASTNDPGVQSVTSKSSSSKSCTLPSLTSTKHSRLSTPSLSSSDGKGKRPLSFSPMFEGSLKQSSTRNEIKAIPIVQHKPLTPLLEPNEVRCQWAGCDLLFSTPIQLTEHIRSVHIDRIDSRTWFCQWQSCARHQQPFKSLYSLFTHLRTHTQDRPYQCSFINCTKTFTRAEYLRLHERSHTGIGEKPYPCEYPDCSKAFSNPSDRTKHVKRTHLNKKEYICQFQGCNKSYTDPSSLRKHVKTVHGEDAFRQKKHKRTDENHSDKRFEETKENISSTHSFGNFQHGISSNNIFETNFNNDYDDDEDIVVDRDMAYNVDVLGDNLGELSVGTAVHRVPMINSLKNLTKKAVLPAIHITSVYDVNHEDETMINQVAFRTNKCHRISAHSASTAYSSMRSDSMNVESALFLPSNHSSMISSVPHPSASPYEYDCNVLQIPSPHSPLRRSQTSVNSSIQTADISPSNSFCVSVLSDDIRQSPTNTSDPKMAHLLYFLQSLDYNTVNENN